MKIDVSDTGEMLFQYEMGDLITVQSPETEWLIASQETATVIEVDQDYVYYVQSTTMKESGWGAIPVPATQLEPAGITKAKIPQLIKEWKERQVKKLLLLDEKYNK